MANRAKTKTPKISTLRNKADRLFQQVGMQNNKYCLVCGSPAQCLHHFITKGASSALRYEEENGIPICQSCHCKIHMTQDPTISITIKEKKGEGWYEGLLQKKRQIVKTNAPFYREVIERLEKQLNI